MKSWYPTRPLVNANCGTVLVGTCARRAMSTSPEGSVALLIRLSAGSGRWAGIDPKAGIRRLTGVRLMASIGLSAALCGETRSGAIVVGGLTPVAESGRHRTQHEPSFLKNSPTALTLAGGELPRGTGARRGVTLRFGQLPA